MFKSSTSFCEQLEIGFSLMEVSIYHSMLITEADQGDKRKLLFEILNRFKNEYPELLENPFNYVIIDNLPYPRAIYDTYLLHQKKLIIFNTEKLFSRKQYRDVLEGGFCSSPDSGAKWLVKYRDQKPFKFNGHVIILTNKPKKYFTANSKKYEYWLRDLRII